MDANKQNWTIGQKRTAKNRYWLWGKYAEKTERHTDDKLICEIQNPRGKKEPHTPRRTFNVSSGKRRKTVCRRVILGIENI